MSEMLPPSWRIASFGELNRYTSITIDPAKYPNEEFELYSVPSYPTGIPDIALGSSIGSSKQLVEPGDVLVCKINPRINRVWLVPGQTNHRQIASSEWIVMRPGELNGRYLRHYFMSDQFREMICADVTGVGGSLTRAQPKRVAAFQIPLPPLAEQQRIADTLDRLLVRVDACRARLGRVPALLKRFRQAVLAAAVAGRLTEDWRGENDVEADWSWTTFGEAGAVSGGLTKNAQRSLIESRKPYLRVANVYANRLELGDVAEIGLTEAEFTKTKLEKDDLLIVEGNGSLDQIGRAALWTGEIADCVHQNHIIRWRAFDHVLPSYALFWLLSPQGRASLVEVASSTTGLHTLSISKISAIPLNVPPLAEQHEIVRRVETLFAYADRLDARLAAAQARVAQLTPSLQVKAFRGELGTTTTDGDGNG
jgi:type I restriction enzyme S subunit